MEKLLMGLLSAIMIPIFILNFFGGIVGGIWLLAIGEWGYVVGMLLIYIFSSWILALLLMIPMPIQMLGLSFAKKKFNFLMIVTLFFGLLLTSVISTGWVLGTFSWMISIHDEGVTLLPLLLVGYALATGPFAYMAKGEDKDSHGTFITVFVTQITYIITVVLYLVGYNSAILPVAVTVALIADVFILVVGYDMYRRTALIEQYTANHSDEVE